jgi:hypothetical protein
VNTIGGSDILEAAKLWKGARGAIPKGQRLFQIIYGGQVINLAQTNLAGELLDQMLAKVQKREYFWLDIADPSGPMKMLIGPGIPFAVKTVGDDGEAITVSDASIRTFLADKDNDETD